MIMRAWAERAAGLALLAAAVCPTQAPAQDKAASPVWEERVITAPLERGDFAGELTRERLDALTAIGEDLFKAKFTPLDGVGRPMATQAIIPTKRRRETRLAFQRMAGMDAGACASCHNEPVAGGAGDFVANVFVSEGFSDADFDSIDPQFSNERNTNHLFGAGLIELLAREMTVELQASRNKAARQARAKGETVTLPLEAKGVSFGSITVEPDGMVDLSGLDGVDTDLVIRPFSQKGVMTSLRQFTVNALNQHHGMEAIERFGARWTGENDFDEDGAGDEITAGDVSALVAWQATLEPPFANAPDDATWRAAAAEGDKLFETIGCASCHIRALPLTSLKFADPGPVDAAGTLRGDEDGEAAVYDLGLYAWSERLERNDKGEVLVPLFGDLKRHRIADQKVAVLGNELLAQRFVDRDVFMTGELWGIADTAPYGHRGDLVTLDEVIRAHGGEGSQSARAYEALPETDRTALIAFLKTLGIDR
jgi:mono/diheme cytochrome c family protein